MKFRLPRHVGTLAGICLDHHYSVFSPHHAEIKVFLVVIIHFLAVQLEILQAIPTLHQQRTCLKLPELPQVDGREETKELHNQGLEDEDAWTR